MVYLFCMVQCFGYLVCIVCVLSCANHVVHMFMCVDFLLLRANYVVHMFVCVDFLLVRALCFVLYLCAYNAVPVVSVMC